MQASESKTSAEAKWLDIQKAWFPPQASLGVMENLINGLVEGHKRDRMARMRRIIQVLSGLGLIPPGVKIAGVAFGCLSTGERGLFLFSSVTTQLRQADLPAYAEERKDATS